MKVLVTGGTGYVGTELIKALIAAPLVSKIVVYDDLSRKNYGLFTGRCSIAKKVQFLHKSILDTHSLQQALEGVDCLFHLAAKVLTPYSHENPCAFEQINQWGTAELSYLLEKNPVKKVIYLSSTAVYGLPNKTVHGTDQTNPVTHYGLSKLRGEQFLLRLSSRMKINIIRSGNVFGPSESMRFDSAINKIVFDGFYGKKVFIDGDGQQTRPFVHVNLLAKFLFSLLEHDLDSGVYNFVNKNLSIIEIVEALSQLVPGLEHQHTNQQFTSNSISVASSFENSDTFQLKESLEELIQFNS